MRTDAALVIADFIFIIQLHRIREHLVVLLAGERVMNGPFP
jgi:hypothetical protein